MIMRTWALSPLIAATELGTLEIMVGVSGLPPAVSVSTSTLVPDAAVKLVESAIRFGIAIAVSRPETPRAYCPLATVHR